MAAGLQDTTIRDYGGGWNVSDSDLNLSSRYQPISNNISRGIDGSFGPRQGTALFGDFANGMTTDMGTQRLVIATTADSTKVTVTFPAPHGLVNGNHITISDLSVPNIGGIPADEIIGTHGVLVTDSTHVSFHVGVQASSTTATDYNVEVVVDTDAIGGNIIHCQYFNRRLIVFTDIGEVGTIDNEGNINRVWGPAEAETLSPGLVPTRRSEHWSSASFKSTVIACNGYNKDKPIQIKADFTAEFLVDKATSSNAAVPKSDYVVCMQGYVIFLRTEYGDPFVEFSAKGTDGTFTRDPNPSDSVEVDLSMITSTVEPVLLGAAPIREKLFTAFYDKGMVGTIGIYSDTGLHEPDFGDTVAENGTISHRTMVSLGNDVFMCDYAGVPSLSISQQSGIFVPVRVSELIAPELQRHLSSVNEDLLRKRAFAVFNTNDRSYMLFVPVYDGKTFALPEDPFIFNNQLRDKGWAMMRAPQHSLFEDTHVVLSGANPIGNLTPEQINGKKRIVSIVDRDNVIIDLGVAPSSTDITFGGGAGLSYTTVNDETFVYVFEYNKEFKIRRWTLYRGWDFDAGCNSQRGKVFLAKGKKVYRMGDNETPLYADEIGDYDAKRWLNSYEYAVGYRILEVSTGNVYTCAVSHTSAATGTFEEFRQNNPDTWELYAGMPIKWALETPWSDMRERGKFKVNKYISIDSEGTDRFTVSAFVNKLRTSPMTNELTPIRALDMQAGDTGGWGVQNSGNFGGGRRTREEKVWPFGIRGKLVRWRYEGSTTKHVRIISHTMYYKLGNIR